MITDKIRVNLKAGRGGEGGIFFFRDGKPSGGNGGHGGDVYLEGTRNLYDLRNLKDERSYKAESGGKGEDNIKDGKVGDDLVLKVPIETHLYDLEGNLITKIEKHEQRELILKGGAGGLGNHHFRAGQVATLRKTTPGKAGGELMGFLELRLVADVVFIGFPNAGKSSMLNALTNASVAVASYPFTTINPHLGVAGGVILMDLPGLIEGASEGKGLGTKFVRHTEKAKIVAHFISLENEDLLDTYTRMRNELKDIDDRLSSLEEIIILTKADMYEEDEINEKKKQLKSTGKKILVTSTFIYDDLRFITDEINNLIS